MKEAIKVQNVTIIIINGISESFQRVRWVRQKTEEVPTPGVGFLLGKNKAGACVAETLPGAGLLGGGGRGKWAPGAGREIAHATDARDRDGEVGPHDCPSGAGRGQLRSRSQFGHQSAVHPGVLSCFSCRGAYCQACLPRTSAAPLPHKQCLSSHHRPGCRPGPWVQTRKGTVFLCWWRGRRAHTGLSCRKW